MKWIHKLFITVLSVLATLFFAATLSTTVHAETVTGVTGDCIWSLDGTVLTISGNGASGSYYDTGPWGNAITKVIIEEGVTSIGSYAFYNCRALTEVSISNTVETIEHDAFHWCNALEEIELPEGLRYIGSRAFVQCHNLKSICIPASVTTMGVNPFLWCSKLVSIEVAEDNVNFFSEGNCLIERSTGILISGCENSVIPENVGIKEIGYEAFSSIEGLEEVIIPYGVEKINEYAFWSCENLVKVEIPETVSYIHPYALQYLDLQVSVSISENNETYHCTGNCIIETNSKTLIAGYSNSVIPTDDSVTKIGDEAFYGARALIDLHIPDNITTIGSNAFANCRNLVNVHIGKGVTYIDRRAFIYCRSLEIFSVDLENPRYCAVDNCLIDTQIKTLVRGTKKSVIPADGTVETIGAFAFYCIETPSIKLPEGVKIVEYLAFSNIVEIELPHSLETLDYQAFVACDELERVLYNGSVEERNAMEELYANMGNEALFDAQWQYGETWEESGIEFVVKDLQVMEKRDSYSPGDDDLYYEKYPLNPIIEIRFADGSTLSGSAYSIENETGGQVHFYDNQSFAKQWGIGEHTVQAYFMGEITEFTVTVIENPIESIAVDPVICLESYDGYWSGHYDDNYNYVYGSWFYYSDEPECLIVKFKDGSAISGDWYEVSDYIEKLYGGYSGHWTDQSYENQWDVGEHTGCVSFLGIREEYTVEVIGIKSLTINDVSILENTTGWCEEEYYYYYNFYPSFSVELTNGDVLASDGDAAVEIAGEKFFLAMDKSVQRNEPWLAGNTYEMSGSLLNTDDVFYITIEPKTLERIEVSTLPNKTEYVVEGSGFTADGGKLTLYYNNGTIEIVGLKNNMVTGFSGETVGEQILTVSYGGKTTAFTVVVENKKLTSIAVTRTPTKLTYVEGEPFDESGMVITAYYNNGTNAVVTDYTVSGYSSTPGTKIIMVSYREKTSAFQVTVDSLGHSFTNYVSDGNASCTKDGTKTAECDYCNTTDTVTDIGSKLGHKYGKYISNNDATTSKDGTKTANCSRCEHKHTVSDPGTKLSQKNGWVMESGNWVFYENSSKVVNCWKLDSKGWCYLTEDGTMAVNRWILDSVGWCYVGADGYCLTNCWMQDSIGWCFLDSEGRMATNRWILDSVGWCYVGADGYCVTNCWMKDSIGWCYLDANGRMVTNGWVMDSKGWCYLGSDGYAVTNCWKQDSVGWCYLDSEGSMVKNAWVDGYYIDANGYRV